MSTSTPILVPAPSPTPAPVPTPSPPPPATFESKLQHLVSDFWNGREDDADSTLEGLQHLFLSLAHELGRVDGVARIFGVPREESLKMLRVAFVQGKQAALVQHRRAAEHCKCPAADVLLNEIETN